MGEFRQLGLRELEWAVLGGALLGGGGGGPMDEGRRLGSLATQLGGPQLVSLDDVPDEALVITVSAVGAPGATEALVTPMDYIRAVELLRESLDAPVFGLVTNENGGTATVNGWLQGVVLGLLIIDAPCNGRAHPTGVMGAMGLHQDPSYVARQAAVGGDPARGKRVSLLVSGALPACSSLVRQAAVQAGGLVAVARNPVTAAYMRERAAAGAISQAIDIGARITAARDSAGGPQAVARAAAGAVGGEVVAQGRVSQVDLKTEGGFDSGLVILDDRVELTFWNEYMTLEIDGRRQATFPDLIATLDGSSGLPVASAEVREGAEVLVLVADRTNLKLGAGMFDDELLRPVEQVIGKEVVGR